MHWQENLNESTGFPTIGLVMLDATTAEINVAHFSDDACRTKLETIVRRTNPKELLFEKGKLNAETMRLLKSCAPHQCVWTGLKEAIEFISPAQARQELETLLGDDIPAALRACFDLPAAMEALGALWSYLTQLNLSELFTARNLCVLDIATGGLAAHRHWLQPHVRPIAKGSSFVPRWPDLGAHRSPLQQSRH